MRGVPLLCLLVAAAACGNVTDLVPDPALLPSPVPSASGVVTLVPSPCAIPTVYPPPDFVLGVSTNCGNAQWKIPDPHAIDLDGDEFECVYACTSDPKDPFPPHEAVYTFDFEPQIDPNAYLGPQFLPCCTIQ